MNRTKIENICVLLNKNKDKNIFAFPPISGYGISYNCMANLLNEHSLYAFDYIEDEDKIAKYVNVIKEIQKKGPYILMAYSAGGRLAFEVAKAILKDGNEVSGIIMIDSYPQKDDSYIEFKENEVDEMYNEYIEDIQDEVNSETRKLYENTFPRKVVIRRMNNYKRYLSSLSICKEKIKTNIYIIKSEQAIQEGPDRDDESTEVWDELIYGKSIQYIGYGKHSKMITKYVEKNMDIIKQILKTIS